mgnify:FL=1
MSTKSEVVYQRALQFKQSVSDINIKHYVDDPKIYPTIVDGIFDEVFRDERQEDNWDEGEEDRRNGEERRERRGDRDRRDDYNDNCTPM